MTFKHINKLTPGDAIAVIIYGGKLATGVYKGISRNGALQYYWISDDPQRNALYPDRIQGVNIDARVVKINPEDLPITKYEHYLTIKQQINFNGSTSTNSGTTLCTKP